VADVLAADLPTVDRLDGQAKGQIAAAFQYAIRSNARLGTEVLQKRSVYCNDARCWIARSRAASSEPRMTSIFSSSDARCPGESDACGSTC
jgi:hypothetical protein